MNRYGLALMVLIGCALPVAAQDTPLVVSPGNRPLLRPDGTYVFNHIPNSNLVFEGQIAPRIIIRDTIAQGVQRVLETEKDPVWGWQVSTTPMVRLRMFDEASNPVRTPSFMPKGTVQLARFRNLSSSTESDEDAFNRGPVAMWLVEVIPFGHHSNGQNGCLFTSQVRDANDDCIDLAPEAPRIVNRENGSFSTNYIEATVHYGRLALDSENAPDLTYATRWEWRAGVGVQLNPKGFLGGSIDDELADLYGTTRLLVEGTAARRDLWRCGRASSDLRLQYIHDAPSGVPDVTSQLEGACFPRNWGGAGLFLRFYRGQDYYNLGFSESISRLQFGVTLQRETFLSFKIASVDGP